MSHRQIILGIVDDSAAGKTTLTRGIAQILGEENVTVIVRDLEQMICAGVPHLHSVCNRESNQNLGKIARTTGEILQSYPLDLTQLLITYHMLKATQEHRSESALNSE